MKTKKYLYLSLISSILFCTIYQNIFAEQASVTQAENTVIQTTQPVSPTCPDEHENLETLSTQDLENLLTCKQEQEKTLHENIEKIEAVLEKKEQDPKKAKEKPEQKKGFFQGINTDRCPYYNLPLKKLTQKQLEEVYEYTQTHTMDPHFIIDLLIRLIALSDNHAAVKKYKLQLADQYYALHHIDKAATSYEDFAILYPGSEEHEYVAFKAVACMFELSLEADRDQSNTHKTIALIKEFLKNPKNKELAEQSKVILQTCYQRLYDHEVYIFNFYLHKKNFKAAQMRLDYIRKQFTETIPALNAQVEALKQRLYNAQNPKKRSVGTFIPAPETLTDNGPVNTNVNKAAKFLA